MSFAFDLYDEVQWSFFQNSAYKIDLGWPHHVDELEVQKGRNNSHTNSSFNLLKVYSRKVVLKGPEKINLKHLQKKVCFYYCKITLFVAIFNSLFLIKFGLYISFALKINYFQ